MSRSGLVCLLPIALVGAAATVSLYKALFCGKLPVPTTTTINFTNVADPFVFSVVDLTGDNQVIYVANITVDGQRYEVQLDTGSSDLWLNTQNIMLSPAVNDTNITASISYGDDSSASGDIFLAAAQFGNFSITQAFINAPGSNATSDNDRGLLGLSSANLSEVYNTLSQNSTNTTLNGLPVLYNIFATYPNVSNFVTFLLARSDLGITDGGVFSIGDVDPYWTAVLNQTQIPVVQDTQQWVGLMDAVIVDGRNFSGHGILSKAKNASDDVKNKTLSLLDTGSSLGIFPKYYWDAIYKDVPGLKAIDASKGLYQLPCDSKRNVSMVFNGTEYPVNSIDLSRVTNLGNFSDGTNQTICVNSFVPGDESSEGVDIILGDSFMRNVYAVFNFGNWTNATAGATPPYMQLLSTTNQTEAWSQFDDLNNARIQQWNELQGQFNLTSATTNASNSSTSPMTSRAHKVSFPIANEEVAATASRTYEYWSSH